jgi:DNA-binding NarL/FixJ family response regulator
MTRRNVLLADDHSMLMEFLAGKLQQEFNVVGMADNGNAMVELGKRHRPDVIVADISMPLLNGIEATRIIRKELPCTKILLLTMHHDLGLVEEAFRAGANGFLLKISGINELLHAIHVILNGEAYVTPQISGDLLSALVTKGTRGSFSQTEMTPRQRQILQLLAEGKSMKQAAAVVGISTRTAESHKYEIMRRLRVGTTAELIRHAIRMKLV